MRRPWHCFPFSRRARAVASVWLGQSCISSRVLPGGRCVKQACTPRIIGSGPCWSAPVREKPSFARSEWRLTPPSSGRPKGRFAPFAPPLMSNVRPRKALALPLRSTPPASSHSARLHLSLAARSREGPARGVRACRACCRCLRARIPVRTTRARRPWARFGSHGGVFTLASQPTSTAAPLKPAGAPGWRLRPRLSSPRSNLHRASGRAAKVPHGFHLGHTRVA